MAGQRLAHRQRPGRPLRGSGPSQAPRAFVRLGHGLDLAGHLCRRDRPEPDSLRLSHDPHHRFLFWGAERTGTGKTIDPRPVIPRGAIGHQFHFRGHRGFDRRSDGGHASKPDCPGGSGRILVFLASSLFGFWELRPPGGLTRMASKSYAGYFGSLFMGLTLGVVAAPCIGPFVLGLLTWVASHGVPPGWDLLSFLP